MSSIQPLLDTMQKLRDKEDGCPWDIEQTFESLSKHLIEEAYEATDAIAKKDYLNLKEELGDVADAILGIPVIEGKVTKTKLKTLTKDELLTIADKKFDTELDSTLTKTNLVNKVYELYYPNKK